MQDTATWGSVGCLTQRHVGSAVVFPRCVVFSYFFILPSLRCPSFPSLLSLQVLESVVKYRWNALPIEQRDGIKNYISDLIVKVSKGRRPVRAGPCVATVPAGV